MTSAGGIGGHNTGGPVEKGLSPLPQRDTYPPLMEEAVQSAGDKLIVVTFKLPLIVEKVRDGEWSVKRSRSILN